MLCGAQEEVELLEELAPPLDLEQVHRGELSPTFFGSAMNNFGVSTSPLPALQPGPIPCTAAWDGVPCQLVGSDKLWPVLLAQRR